jgi:hypothetical protein
MTEVIKSDLGRRARTSRDPEASDKPSDNDPRQHQTVGDALRHQYLSDVR